MIPEHATSAEFRDYLIIFEDDAPPKRVELTALSDEHAVDRLMNQYPGFRWKVYRAGEDKALYEHKPIKKHSH